MGKKTLKQKKRADEKKLHQHQPSVNQARGHETSVVSTYTFTSQSNKHGAQHQTAIASQLHMAYVAQDLRKTLFLSLSVVVLEVILYFLLHSHILALPFIRY